MTTTMARARTHTKSDAAILHTAIRNLGEVALESRSREEFRLSSLELICRAMSMDSGALNHTATGIHIRIDSFGLDVDDLRPVLPIYMNEMSAAEVQRSIAYGRFVSDDSVFTRRRRESLRLYREYFKPRCITLYAVRAALNRHGMFWATFSREGRHVRYNASELRALDALFPLLAIGDALHANKEACAESDHDQTWGWLLERGVTRRECRVVDMLQRGLTMAEAAHVLGESRGTLRRQMGTVLAKLRFSSPAQLLRVLSDARGPTIAGEAGGLISLIRQAEMSRPAGPGTLQPATERPAMPPRRVGGDAARRLRGLSPREQQTLRLLLEGLSDKDLADRLRISRHTVNQYTKAIYACFDLHSRSSLLAYWMHASETTSLVLGE